ncbi:MAG: arginine repressor [Prevotella sp.]|jgi:transcriptional regulator of arginine metabolism|nr:arginine repressor [Prevotella sp.]
MKIKTKRLEAIRTLISNNELGSQNEILDALRQQGFELTQATLSRDMKQLKIAKAASMNGKYVYVLPNETMYRRVHVPISELDLAHTPGFLSINFSGNIAVIHTRPGYASSVAYNIDQAGIDEILGTIAGDDTIVLVLRESIDKDDIVNELRKAATGDLL